MNGLYVRTKTRQYGPLTETEFRKMAQEGWFTGDDLIWHYNKNIWIEAKNIERYKPFFAINPKYQKRTKILAIGSGKGGVGKTALAASMGIQIADMGKKVVLVDADFNTPNLHMWMGIDQPHYTLRDYFQQNDLTLQQIAIETKHKNLRIVCGALADPELSNLKYFQIIKLVRELRDLDADFVIMDLGSGTAFKVSDLFLAADDAILITVPEPTALVDAFSFVKISLIRELRRSVKFSESALKLLTEYETMHTTHLKLSLKNTMLEIKDVDEKAYAICAGVLKSLCPKIVLNMVLQKEEDKEGHILSAAFASVLLIKSDYLGYINYDPNLRVSSRPEAPNRTAGQKFHNSAVLSNFTPSVHLNQQNELEKIKSNQDDWHSILKSSSIPDSYLNLNSTLFGNIIEPTEVPSEKNNIRKYNSIASLE